MKNKRGFTLVEVAIVMMIVGLMIGAGLNFQKSIVIKERSTSTRDRIASIKNAMEGYIANAGTLPCPAALDAALGTPAFGAATDCNDTTVAAGTCNGSYCVAAGRSIDDDNDPSTPNITLRVRIGAVPARALSLPFEVTRDGWNNRLVYVVTEKLARSASFYDSSHGGVEVVDDTGATVLNQPGSAHYVVYSPGANEVGAYAYVSGVQVMPCTNGNTTKDEENCNNDATFRSGLYADAGNTSHYDDMINYVANVAPASGSSGSGGTPITLWVDKHIQIGSNPNPTTVPLPCPTGYTKVYDGRAAFGYGGSGGSQMPSPGMIGPVCIEGTMRSTPTGNGPLGYYGNFIWWDGESNSGATTLYCTVCIPG